MAVYAIGDIQGCLEPFQRLLEQLRSDQALVGGWFRRIVLEKSL